MRSRINKSSLAVGLPQHVRKPDERKDTSYIAVVRLMPCLICGRPGGIAHHLMRVEPNSRGVAFKNADRWALPLCVEHHDEQFPDSIHRFYPGGEEAWLARKGIDGREIARALYMHRNDEKRMRRVVERSLLERGVYG